MQTMCKKANTQSKTKQATGRAMNIVNYAQERERERTKERSVRKESKYRKFEQSRAQAQNHLTQLVSMLIS